MPEPVFAGYICSMLAEIITIGDEILIGQIVDTNSAWMGQQLNRIGVRVHQITSVSDEKKHILAALEDASGRADIILLTGGLGPTRDDITKHTLCEYFNTTLVFNEDIFKDVERLFHQRGRTVTEVNRMQAEVPASCIPLPNKTGTAPGMWFQSGGKIIVSMPGVPYEMKHLMTEQVLPRIVAQFKLPVILHHTILTQGIGESMLAERLVEFEDNLPEGFKLAYLPSPGMVRLRLSAYGLEKEKLQRTLNELVDKLTGQTAEFIYGHNDDSIAGVVGKLLAEKGMTVSTAESCTGGYVSHLLTAIPGSSAWYMGSTITYSYKSKTDILEVPAELINSLGAVSEEVVRVMADNVKKKLGTDCSIATSGIAGPGGGTPAKPVGTVWVAVSTPKGTTTRLLRLGDDRLRNIEVASQTALNILRQRLMEE
jgi:nicotinamide-nucleotide amidase